MPRNNNNNQSNQGNNIWRERERERMTLQQAYEVFELPEGNSIEEIAKKYRKLSLTCHPDSRSRAVFSLDPAEKAQRWQKISQAYEVIAISLMTEEQKDMEKDEVIAELRHYLSQAGLSNHYYIAVIKKLTTNILEN